MACNRLFAARPSGRGARAAVALSVSGLLLLTGCGGGSGGDSGDAAGASGEDCDDTLSLALENTVPGWDYRQQIGSGHPWLQWRAVYDTLLKNDVENGSILPGAAEEWSYNEDKTELTLKLRDGMTFTDGAPVDAEAAKRSLEGFRDGGGPGAVRLRGITVDVVDDLTITVTLPGPMPALLFYLGDAPGALVSPASIDSPTMDTQPVGSGPYVLDTQNSVTGSKLLYDRNPDYWNPDDYPYDKLEILIMADETAQLNALATGQIDGAEVMLASIEQAESSGSHVESFPNLMSGFFFVDRAGTNVPALGDVRVRQAINMVFDREAIVQSLWNGHGTANPQIFSPTTSGFQEDLLDYYDYDVEGAKKLMEEAGYASGFDVMIPEIAGYQDEYTAITVQQLALLNIRAQVVPLPRQESLPRLTSGEFPMFVYKVPANIEVNVVANYAAPGGAYNPYRNQDPELDELLAEWEVADQTDAAQIYQQINEFLVENAWFAPFGNPDVSWAFNDCTSITGTQGGTPPLHAFE
ncbi:MAG TPA: ABC transporter substrate-binding protein [Streptomyces sp.]|uniref:ABC transporter substrate-binding protein n=1 Tax=Streptomyces sp. TaxID=1931 RepID=UPI002CA82836|nr:ABC transporter substrate-binding protein [Streptomyces sp.]HWU05411.1 ABC transporter substrate-binding protein [Streptomyces sp.]